MKKEKVDLQEGLEEDNSKESMYEMCPYMQQNSQGMYTDPMNYQNGYSDGRDNDVDDLDEEYRRKHYYGYNPYMHMHGKKYCKYCKHYYRDGINKSEDKNDTYRDNGEMSRDDSRRRYFNPYGYGFGYPGYGFGFPFYGGYSGYGGHHGYGHHGWHRDGEAQE